MMKKNARDTDENVGDDISNKKRWNRKMIINPGASKSKASSGTINLALKEDRSIYRQYAMQDIRDAAQNAEEKKQLLQNKKAEYLQIIRDAERRQKVHDWYRYILNILLGAFMSVCLCAIIASGLLHISIVAAISTLPMIWQQILSPIFLIMLIPVVAGGLLFAERCIHSINEKSIYVIYTAQKMIQDIEAELAKEEPLQKTEKLPNSHEMQPDNASDLNPQAESEREYSSSESEREYSSSESEREYSSSESEREYSSSESEREYSSAEQSDDCAAKTKTPSSTITLDKNDGNKEKGGSVTALFKNTEPSHTPDIT